MNSDKIDLQHIDKVIADFSDDCDRAVDAVGKEVEKYLHDATDELTLILKGQLLVENKVNELLEQVLPRLSNPSSKKKKGLAVTLKLLESLGFEDSVLKQIKALKDIRDKMAHRLDYKLKKSDVISISANPLYDGDTMHQATVYAVRWMVTVISMLISWERRFPLWAAIERDDRILYKDPVFSRDQSMIEVYEKAMLKSHERLLEKLETSVTELNAPDS